MDNSSNVSTYMSDFTFKLPIEYTSKKRLLDKNIITDLELLKTDEHKSLYEDVFDPKSTFGRETMKLWPKYFSYDKNFLKDNQKLLKNFKNKSCEHKCDCDDILTICDEINNEEDFLDKYQYIDFPWFKKYNDNENILLALSLYNMSSPIIAILTPIILLIMPFFIIKIQGHNITLEKYIEYLKVSFSKHTLGQLINTDFNEIPVEKKMYIGMSVAFYGYQIYQNVLSCVKFHTNMQNIHHYLLKIRDYTSNTISSINNFYNYSKKLKTYKSFNLDIMKNKGFLETFHARLSHISKFEYSIPKILQIGKILKLFYVLHEDTDYMNNLTYSFGFNGFIENFSGIQENIKSGFMNMSSSGNKCKFTDTYFPALKNENPIKNSYTLNKHMIITGPNAAGKTTLLKSNLINVILNQQIGCGFYKSATLKLYNYIHCYINIPDTSGRDSLFQAEARRCKEIIDKISKNSIDKNHLCVFDELYSGTNPYEAVGSAYSLIKYLNDYKNINFMLTTHYIDLCDKLDDVENIENCNMKILEDKDAKTFEYTYKLQKGISYVKGGTKVLNDLKYPSAIVDSVKEIIDTLKI
jgi:energy-coupling factor transporter ATP-binding protein EcfA2